MAEIPADFIENIYRKGHDDGYSEGVLHGMWMAKHAIEKLASAEIEKHSEEKEDG